MDLTDRKTLIASLPHGGVYAEIGVAAGLFSNEILELCKPSLLVLIDCWEHQSEAQCGQDPANHPQHIQDACYEDIVKRFATEPVHAVRAYSGPASQLFSDGYFDWVYIDANHLQARQDAEVWWPKVKSGGYLMGHDYTVAGDFITVKTDIDAWAADEGLTLQVAGLESDDIYERNYPTWIARKP